MEHYSLYWIAQIHELSIDNLFTYKEPMTCILCATPNASKLCTMQEIWVECSNQCQCIERITRGQSSLTLLHHVLLLEVQSQQLSSIKVMSGLNFEDVISA